MVAREEMEDQKPPKKQHVQIKIVMGIKYKLIIKLLL